MRELGEHAVVLGAGIAGLLAARVLSEAFERVTIIERDRLPASGDRRLGVPQGGHVHGLLVSGFDAVDTLFAGFTANLHATGALVDDIAGCSRGQLGGHRDRRPPSGLRGLAMSRPLLEATLCEHVLELPGVELLEGHDAISLLSDLDHRRVTGLRVLREMPRPDGCSDASISADLVVDASGHGSRTPAWLPKLGYRSPDRQRIEAGLRYASRVYEVDPEVLDGEWLLLSAWGFAGRWSAALQLDGQGQGTVTLSGRHGHRPPLDPAGFEEVTARFLGGRHEVISRASPIGDPVGFDFPASFRDRYERLHRFPAGLLVLGDALSSVDPTHGLGMSMAVRQAIALRACLAAGSRRLAPRFFRSAAKIVDSAWRTVKDREAIRLELDRDRTVRVSGRNASRRRVDHAVPFG